MPQRGKLNEIWYRFIESSGGIDKMDIQSDEFKKMVRKGIGSNYRTPVWIKITSLDRYMEKRSGMYEKLKLMHESIPSQTKRIIDCDIIRTWPKHPGFTSEQLKNVLYSFHVAHPEIGYTQGLNFFAAIFVLYLGEESGFWMLCNLIENYFPHDYFCNQLKDFQIDLRMIEIIIKERIPDVAKHAEELHHEWMLPASGWLLTLFTNSFPMATVMRIWDCFLLEGSKVIYRVCIAFIRLHHDILLEQQDKIAFTRMVYMLQSEMIDDEKLIDLAFKLKAFSKNHIIELREMARNSIGNDTNFKTTASAVTQKLFGLLNM
ncbi:TBC domain containing protein [Tritrichomonas foetus]|uniref:TBC domain containing protein n=1 Tax=Tritrichomonas foetus TaxID=1144522 RepID=A0A1J4K7C4_9EUKA|nr:TBC domain containing protein [Tritrichomonas foetus]|eukprot:OHT05598.1 TBC domain containing protein [Tritrichomonas foetus]